MNLKEILQHKINGTCRFITTKSNEEYNKGDEIGVEEIDFSIGCMRCSNKTSNMVFYLYYDKDTWDFEGNYIFK